jgi:hypothetical protein
MHACERFRRFEPIKLSSRYTYLCFRLFSFNQKGERFRRSTCCGYIGQEAAPATNPGVNDK